MPARRLLRAARTTAGLGAGLAVAGCVVSAAVEDAPAHALPATEGRLADGTFAGSGTYETPGGPQRIDVTVVLTDGVVQSLRVDPVAANQTSRRFQERFASAVAESVVGRPLSEVTVDRVAGSSATGKGFAAALAEVVRDASGA